MRAIGVIYIIIGVAAIIGALGAAFVVFSLSDALNVIRSADVSQLPANTDVAALQESVSSLNLLITLSWVWIICVLLAGVISIYFGIITARSKKK